MKIFSIKSIGLYSLAIGSAIAFFQLVTSYGEANVKAPISVSGSYLISGQDLPGCLHNKALLFKLQQSGIYLNANLIAIDESKGVNAPAAIDSSRGRLRQRFSKEEAAPTEKAIATDIRPTFSGKLSTSTLPNKLDLTGRIPTKICPLPSQLRVTGLIASADAPIYDRTPQLQGKLWLTSQDLTPALPVDFTGAIQIKTPSSIQSH
jgi:hypothetical protein